MAGGRPSKYKPEYCEKIIDHMRHGKSQVSFAASIGVDRDTIYEWDKNYPEFSGALKEAKSLSQDYWEDLIARGTAGEIKGFNVVGAIFIMKNRFSEDWREKQLVEHSGALSLESIIAGSSDKPVKPNE